MALVGAQERRSARGGLNNPVAYLSSRDIGDRHWGHWIDRDLAIDLRPNLFRLRALNHQDLEARNVFEVLPVSSENLKVMLNGNGGNPDILGAVCAGGSPAVQEGG
jgi:hypothetical protein